MSVKQQFEDEAKAGRILTIKCLNCGHLHLATVRFCQKCNSRKFENSPQQGVGKVVTYTIMTVTPAGFEKYAPYAWVVVELDGIGLRVSGFMANIKSPDDLPIGTLVKVAGFDDRGILIERQ